MIGQRRARDALPYVLLAGVVAVSAVIPGAGLLGEWESSTIFSTFGVRENSLSLAIAPRGNVGGAGYAVLEVVRPLLERLDLQPTLMTLRLPVIACGMIALAFFFVLAKRCFGTWPSLGATALLAVNPIFSEFQHELIVVGPSLMAFIIFLERLQALSLRRELWRNWILFSLSLVLVFLLYGPGRILAVTIWMLWGLGWVIRFLSARDYQSLGKFGVKNFTSAIFIAFTLVGLSTTNVRFLGSRLLFPKNSENFLVSDSSVAPLTTIWFNARIVAESLILGGGANHSDTLELALSGGRFALIPIVVVPIYLAGLGISLWRVFKVRDPLRSPYSMIVVLVFLTTVPMVTSSVFESVAGSSTELLSSLSTYRLAYFLVPAYLAVAVAISWFSAAKVWVRSVITVLVSVLFLTSASSIITSRSNFEREMSRVDPSLVGEVASSQWSLGRRQQGYSLTAASHLQQHLQYWRWASAAVERLETISAQDEVVVLSTSVSCFTEAPLKPQSLDFYDVNFHSVFLAVYLSELMRHTTVAYTFLAPLDGERRGLVEKEGVYSAVLLDPAPVIVLEHRWLYEITGDVDESFAPAEIGKAAIMRVGGDVTLVGSSYMTLECLRAADILARNGISAEVIDLRTVAPLDLTAVQRSVASTGRLVVVDSAHLVCGVTAEILASVAESGVQLKSPPIRLGFPAAPTPTSTALSANYYPRAIDIMESVAMQLGLAATTDWLRDPDEGSNLDQPNPSFVGPY